MPALRAADYDAAGAFAPPRPHAAMAPRLKIMPEERASGVGGHYAQMPPIAPTKLLPRHDDAGALSRQIEQMLKRPIEAGAGYERREDARAGRHALRLGRCRLSVYFSCFILTPHGRCASFRADGHLMISKFPPAIYYRAEFPTIRGRWPRVEAMPPFRLPAR